VHTKPRTRIQREKEGAILEAALDLFSENGFSGTTLDQIALAAGMSKPNVLYYFPSKEELYSELLNRRVANCFAPLESMNPNGDPIEELRGYIRRKMEISRAYPRESRLYASEMLRGAPMLCDSVRGLMRALIDAKAEIIQGWIDSGHLAPIDPKHLIIAIWATTRQYTNFTAEIRGIATGADSEVFEGGMQTIETLILDGLRPR
jgi:TetR/AcrR family transcriptional regulator